MNWCWTDVFIDSLQVYQCENMASNYSMECHLDAFGCSYFNMIFSETSMTIGICLDICSTNGFVYAGLNA
jgi:hypothetical protein